MICYRTEEEKKQAAEEEIVKLEADEMKAWEALQVAQERLAHLDEIVEQEKAEAERKAEEAKIEANRLETERILEEERYSLCIRRRYVFLNCESRTM